MPRPNRPGALAPLRALATSLGQDVRWGWLSWPVNAVAASPLCPRVLRWALLRAGGIRTSTPNIAPRCSFTGGAGTTIGAGTFVNVGCYFEATAPIVIGADCQFGPEVMFVTSHHPSDEQGRVSRVPQPRGIVVGDRCWFGARVTVLPGVRIGDDVVVAAGAVVTRDLAGPGRYGGVPAVPLGGGRG
ncbi:MAG: DapH/DapD/GlmU-related protein [Kineosporiaceae bacterium]